MTEKQKRKLELETCKAEALKYDTIQKFIAHSPEIYRNAYDNYFINKICDHMIPSFEINKTCKWNYETCRIEALKYNTRNEFNKKNRSAYEYALSCDILKDISVHMPVRVKRNGYWGRIRCQEEALKYKTRTQFRNYSYKAYITTIEKDWFEDCCSHMKTNKDRTPWTKERCMIKASKIKSIRLFKKRCPDEYDKACLKNWLTDICKHMDDKSKKTTS